VAQRDRGLAVVIVSSELDEIYALSDRIAVMYEGKIVGFCPPDTPEHELGLMMAGVGAGGADGADSGQPGAPGQPTAADQPGTDQRASLAAEPAAGEHAGSPGQATDAHRAEEPEQ
jgi:simple sugar transport system ATP-binding protein